MADQGFECDFCSTNFKMVQDLRKHYRNIHNLSEEEAIQRTDGLKEPKKECPNCNKSVIRLDRHVCPKEQFSPPKGQRAAKKPNCGNVLPSTSGACALPSAPMRESPSTAMFELSLSGDQASTSSSRPGPIQTFERQAMIPEILSAFEKYVVQPTAGGNSKRTAQNYKGYIRAFLSFIVQENDVNTARRVFNVSARGDNYFALPHPGDWVESAYASERDNNSSRLGCFNAYIKFADFLLFKLQNNRDQFRFDQNEFMWRKSHIEFQKESVKNLNRSLSNRSTCSTNKKADEMIQKQKEEAKEKKRAQEEAREEESFKRTEKHKLFPSERKLLRTTFDPKNRDTLLAKDIDEAVKNNKEFATFFSHFKARENITDQQTKVILQNSYRASKRAENKKR